MMRLYVPLAIGLAIGLIVSTSAQQEKPSPGEQDRAQIVAGREGTTRGSFELVARVIGQFRDAGYNAR
jgi:hypothetical protein